MFVTWIALTLAFGGGSFKAAAEEHCMTGDSAICLADPDCHWDGAKRGCYPGAAERVDPCGVHGDKAICEGDASLGCKWTAVTNKCESTN